MSIDLDYVNWYQWMTTVHGANNSNQTPPRAPLVHSKTMWYSLLPIEEYFLRVQSNIPSSIRKIPLSKIFLIIHWAKKKGSHPSTKVLFFLHCSCSRLESREWRQKISLSSQSMRPKDRNSRSRLEAQDQKTEILDLVSKHETERQQFSISSRSTRPKDKNSRSRLEAWDWKEEILDLVSRVKKCISLWSAPPPVLYLWNPYSDFLP